MSANALLHRSSRAEIENFEILEATDVVRWVIQGVYGVEALEKERVGVRFVVRNHYTY